MRVPLSLFLAGLPVLGLWLVLDWIWVMWPQLETSGVWRAIGWALIVALPSSIFFALFRLTKKGILKPAAAVVWVILGTIVWGYVAWTLVINFQLAIGGGL